METTKRYPILVFTSFAFRDIPSFKLMQTYEMVCAYCYTMPDNDPTSIKFEYIMENFLNEMLDYDSGRIEKIENADEYREQLGEITKGTDFKNNFHLNLIYLMIYEDFNPHKDLYKIYKIGEN